MQRDNGDATSLNCLAEACSNDASHSENNGENNNDSASRTTTTCEESIVDKLLNGWSTEKLLFMVLMAKYPPMEAYIRELYAHPAMSLDTKIRASRQMMTAVLLECVHPKFPMLRQNAIENKRLCYKPPPPPQSRACTTAGNWYSKCTKGALCGGKEYMVKADGTFHGAHANTGCDGVPLVPRRPKRTGGASSSTDKLPVKRGRLGS